ncbi:MAG: 2-hydroxyacid dehydrogenase [Flavobacteriaceae bacterium]|jgi:D-lactate dehydrogenase|nr:2-hydroxyacid dehydrogenase [Flavobacteriaceae bacterium]
MRIAFFSTQPYDKAFFDKCNVDFGYDLEYFETGLEEQTVSLVPNETDAVCVFVNDKVDKAVIQQLADKKVKYIALRCAGFNNVDLDAAHQHGIRVCRVPAYSPEAVAEHTLAMLFTLNRKIHKAYNRVREQNFSLNGLLGTNIYKKTTGVIGTGNIGAVFCRMMKALGTEVLAYDVVPNEELIKEGIKYVSLDELFAKADIISLHCPLTPETMQLINQDSLAKMKDGVMIINTSRGKLIDTQAIIHSLRAQKVGALGIDVYEQEEKVFFRDLSGTILEDERLQLLTSFPNVLVTAHQAFFTDEALTQIAFVTLDNLKQLTTTNEIVGRVAEL